MKNQKGVSLITLVITIIVVIILAAIALGNGTLNLGARAQFTGFVDKMGQLRDDFTTATEAAKTDVTLANLAEKSNAQLRNYVARGGEINDFSTESAWISQAAADRTVTQIVKTGKIGAKICPVIKVETPAQQGLEVEYFVTAGGNVFCWPPYIHDGKAYVNATTVATQDDNGSGDFAKISDAIGGNAYIVFPNGEKVKVSNSGTVPTGVTASTSMVDGTVTAVVYTDAAAPAKPAGAAAVTYSGT